MRGSCRPTTCSTLRLSSSIRRIGRRIHQEILEGDRADYGKRILATLSQELSQSYGNGFSYSALTRMVKFYESFPDDKIVATMSQQFCWSHFRELLPLEKPLQRDFYADIKSIRLLPRPYSWLKQASYETRSAPAPKAPASFRSGGGRGGRSLIAVRSARRP